ncbi:MAG TPA: TolC family protein [Bryobacteraceae bacterium]|nr:TolC family protein [Bryobacteraceae bacterium]
MNTRILLWTGAAALVCAQTPDAHPTLTLQDAIARARQYGGVVQSATLAAAQTQEDTKQVRAARLPQVNWFNQYINTQGDGTPSGIFVANDGVHVYNEQGVVHEELFSAVRRGELNRALLAEAIARAKVEIAARGLNATVIQNYYAILSAQHRIGNARQSVQESEHFLEITGKLEKGGEAAHADVVKAQIEVQARQRDVQEAQLNLTKAKIALGVLLFPNFSADFDVVDDLSRAAALPAVGEAQSQAAASSPDLKAATTQVEEAGQEISVARYQYLPSFGLDFFYGIDANQFAVTSHEAQATGRSTLPNYEVAARHNLGYVAQATLNVPVWTWGSIHSKVKQAEIRREQARSDLSVTRRIVDANVAAAYAEAQGAQAQIASLRQSVDLARESVRLTLLRYQAGEATALEVVDAQTTLAQARGAYDEGLARFRVALAELQTLTGSL